MIIQVNEPSFVEIMMKSVPEVTFGIFLAHSSHNQGIRFSILFWKREFIIQVTYNVKKAIENQKSLIKETVESLTTCGPDCPIHGEQNRGDMN